MSLHEELGDLRRALDEVSLALRPLRERPAPSRLRRRRHGQEGIGDAPERTRHGMNRWEA